MAEYSTPGILLCRSCNRPIRLLPSRFWPYRRAPLDAAPVADGRLAISERDGAYRTMSDGERPLAQAIGQAYQYHECATKGAA